MHTYTHCVLRCLIDHKHGTSGLALELFRLVRGIFSYCCTYRHHYYHMKYVH